MTVNYTTNLALGQPVTGTESGTWGNDVNNAVTSYLDIAIAGGLAITITTANVTLTLTQGDSSATNIVSTTAQYAILNISGAKTAARSLIVPSSSRHYIINNSAATGGFLLTVKGAATTGVTLVDGEKAIVAWNGTDYVKIASSSTTALTSGRVVYTATGGLLTDSANLLYSGTDLTVYGITVGRGGGAVSTSTAVGASALAANTGARNSGVGSSALAANQGGTDATAFGYLALSTGTAVSDCTAIGSNALKVNTSTGQTAVGSYAMAANTTGINNTAVGYSALNANTTSSENTAIGSNALKSTTGASNTGVGNNALSTNSSGSNNTAVGGSALSSNSTGTNNTSVGQASLVFNTASGNSALGTTALYTNSSGIDSTAVGFAALYSNSTGNYNVALGRSALYSCTGNNNIGLGYSAGSLITSGNYNVIIGQYSGSAAPISGTGSSWIVLSDGGGTVQQVIDSAGNATFGSGAVVVYAPAPAAITTTATLTNANLQAQLISTTGTSYTVTMPTGSTMDTLVTWYKVDVGYDFSVINTASGTITMAVNTGVTSLGALTITTGTSARFRIRRTAASTYVLYRIS